MTTPMPAVSREELHEQIGSAIYSQFDMDSISPASANLYWRASPGDLRRALVEGQLMVTPGVDAAHGQASPEKARRALRIAMESIRAGRFFWMGEWPGHTKEDLGHKRRMRGLELFLAGHINHPYEAPYLVGYNYNVQIEIYLIDPSGRLLGEAGPSVVKFVAMDHPAIGRTLALCSGGTVGYGDEPEELRMSLEFFFPFLPSHLRARECHDFYTAVYYTMLVLNTDGVTLRVDRPGDKLNKARIKNRKMPLPPMTLVDTQDYITALQHERYYDHDNEPHGTHASPIPHLRRGHVRRLSATKTTWVRDCMVNILRGGAASPRTRSHYELEPS